MARPESESHSSAPPGDTLLHVADVHFWEVVRNPLRLMNKRFLGNLNVVLKRRRQFHTHRAAEYIEHLAAAGPRQVLFTGDFTSTSTSAEFAMAAAFVRELANRGLDVHVAPGNHDVYTFGAARSRAFERSFEGLAPAQGYPVHLRLAGGTSLILAPTIRPNILSSRGIIGASDLEIVRRMLSEASDPVIVAGHYPVLHETEAYRTPWSRRLINAEAFRSILGACGRRVLYVAGHVHRFSLTADALHPALTHLTTGALMYHNPATRQSGEFSEIHAGADGFQVWRHVFGETWERRPAQ